MPRLAAQSVVDEVVEEATDKSFFLFSPRLGFDLKQWYQNNTPYIDYKGGIDLGFSADYYWNWIGLGLDFDYIKNRPENLYPTEFDGTDPDKWKTSEQGITRIFLGVGPSFKYQTKGNFMAELNLRGGLANIKGGRTEHSYDFPPVFTLNFHAGYDDKMVPSGKAQLRATYFFNENWGVQGGAYYMIHFGVEESTGVINGDTLTAFYYPFKEGPTPAAKELSRTEYHISGHPQYQYDPVKHTISSVGLFMGITYRMKPKKRAPKPVAEEKPAPCLDCDKCDLTITAKDKISGQLLPDTDVVLTDASGKIIQTGKTNAFGVVVFKDVKQSDYVLKGKLYENNLEEVSISKGDFEECIKNKEGMQREMLYTNPDFILKGQVFECNTTTPLSGAQINLKEANGAFVKNTTSSMEGKFIFKIPQSSVVLLKGEKDGYFSNQVKVNTAEYDRAKDLFIKFEMCADPCGKAIRLNNINFDLDKAEILPQSIPDLQRIVRLMKENPNIKVEMSSHTDSRGSKAYNQRLSQRRANATVEYLVSQGISRDRLIARGAGETELLNECDDHTPCPEEKHRVNRRTEFKIICN